MKLEFPPELPISARVQDISRAIAEHQVVIVAGATGSGKTTQLPKIVLSMGRGEKGVIAVTQPRRIAATSVATRVASELSCALGNEVGYQIRFEERAGPNTRVKFMTDGILLAEIQGDRLLRRYDTIILDEAHERSLNIDFLLGWLKRVLAERRDLKLVVSSATLELARFSEFFSAAPVIEVEGRTFPVEVLYEPPAEELELADAVADAVKTVTSLDPRGDILVFLPGEREIHEAERALLALNLRHTRIQPLYARLSAADQRAVFASIPERRVILSTNVAETSLTLPGIVYVIDTGVARLSRYDPRTGTTRLQIEAISQASADQRKGRCGRVREGICVRLYDEPSFAARAPFTDPEIRRTGLAGVILRMKSLRLGDVEEFPFLDPPHSRSIAEGYRVLSELAALDARRELTALGEQLSRFPVDPRIARMILAGAEHGCLQEILIIAAALNIQDPRERPRGAEQKAAQQQLAFRDERSDFVGLLRLWQFADDAARKGTAQLRRVCKDSFLSFLRVREWREIHRQLGDVVRELRIEERPRRALRQKEKPGQPSDDYRALHLALLSGLLSKIGRWQAEQRMYVGAKQTRFLLHPSSGLAKKPPAWVMAFELVQTSQLFARTAAKIEPEWLEQAGEHLLKRSHSDPHWTENSARTSIKEHATLFGLPVFRDRSVDYAAVDPPGARKLFIEHALVRNEYKTRGAFLEHNRALLAEVARFRDKARLSDMLADDEALFKFFDRAVPESVVNGKTFEAWRESVERTAPEILHLKLEDVLALDERLIPAHYPDSLRIQGVELAVSYRFDPAADNDGITLGVPLALLPQLEPGELDWTIPAWHEHKVTLLLQGLPRALRSELALTPERVREIATRLVPFQGELLPALSRVVLELCGVSVPEAAFRLEALPGHLRATCQVIGEHGKVLAESRDIAALFRQYRPQARDAFHGAATRSNWERCGVTSWDFGELSQFVTRRVLGSEIRAYPAIVDRKTSVELVLLESAQAAQTASRLGVLRLLAFAARRPLAPLVDALPGAFPKLNGAPISRAEEAAFRESVTLRALALSFNLGDDAQLPRTKDEFDALLARGTPRMASAFRAISAAISAASSELGRTISALKQAEKQPSGKAAITEIRNQLAQLFPPDLLDTIELEQLAHFPRYLRAAQIRLGRAVSDPRRDAEKFAPFAPHWTAFLARRASARDQNTVSTLRWAFEELRVAIFAPEVKPALPVSVASVSALLSELR
ncbi:MAG TPA: ATP-dependent RNA helicase HrpA [Polyangiaceae bacterium]|nr:ATP-dependent RNA helicase HrpA [Polyangiaceae bacterium]